MDLALLLVVMRRFRRRICLDGMNGCGSNGLDHFLCLMFDTTIDASRARLADGNAYFSLDNILFPVYL